MAYLGAAAFPHRRIAWGRIGLSGRGSLAGGDREAFGWPVSRGLPQGVSITPQIQSPGVLRGVPLQSEVERADLHLIPSSDGLWCLAVEVTDESGSAIRGGSGPELGRDLEKQDILFHTIVHDLASPLSGIVGCLTAIEDGPPSSEDLHRLVGLGLRQAHRQERLIEQILDVFRASNDDGKEVEATPPDLRTVVRRLVENLQPSFSLHGVSLKLEDLQTEHFPHRVVGEETRLERVLANLLDNGLRHAPEGSEVVVRLEGTDRAGEVSVLDRGPGVPAHRQTELFQKLRQGETRGKLGLGLYFCRITVQRWGGQIGYAPRDGGGARFWFRLPWALERDARDVRRVRLVQSGGGG